MADDTKVSGIPELTPESGKPADHTNDLDISMEELGDLQDLIADEHADESADALANILEEDKAADIDNFIEDAMEQMEADNTDANASSESMEEAMQATEPAGEATPEQDNPAEEIDIPDSNADVDEIEGLQELVADENINEIETDAAPVGMPEEEETDNIDADTIPADIPEMENKTQPTEATTNIDTAESLLVGGVSDTTTESADEPAPETATTNHSHNDIEAAVEEMESYIGASHDTSDAMSGLEEAAELTEADVHSILGDDVAQEESHEVSPDETPEVSPMTEKKIQLTQADYADAEKLPDDMPDLEEIEQSIEADIKSGDGAAPMTDKERDIIQEPADESGNTMDLPIVPATTETTQRNQENTSKRKAKTAPAKNPSAVAKPARGAGLATVAGLLAILIASGSLWFVFSMSKRIHQLESRLSGMQHYIAMLTPHNDIVSLNRKINKRMDKLDSRLAAHLKTIAQTKVAAPVPEPESKKLPTIPVMTSKSVGTAVTPIVTHKHKPWVINLISFKHTREAKNEAVRLNKLGVHAETFKIKTHGKIWFRVRVPGFANAKDAEQQRKVLIKQLGIRDTWIGRYKKRG